MLCEKCKTKEATVHITEVIGDAPDEMKKRDFCEACFSQTDLAKKLKRKMPQATSPGSTAIILPNDERDR